MVVLKLARPRTEACGSEDALALDVDLFDRSGIEIRVRAQTSNWTNRVYEPDAARNHFREHRLKDYIVLSVHQRDLDRPKSKGHAGEAAPGSVPCRLHRSRPP